MNWYRIFYWITVADGVKNFFDVFSNIFTFLTVAGLIFYIANRIYRVSQSDVDKVECDSWGSHFAKFFWISMLLCIVTWGGYVFTPTKKDALLIVAGGAVGNFITSDSSAKQIPSELTNLLRLKIKDEIEQIKSPGVGYIRE